MPWVSRSNPTYLRVNARQRPGGVAWDAVPLTVRGLNKAAGNPPLDLKYLRPRFAQKGPSMRSGKEPYLPVLVLAAGWIHYFW